ncbi:MAG: hypothetical protein CMP57_02010 [Flavobacteriales bacterium]|nr:hypothetical protein [Flavobacteriales bacterium]|tara:strand:- start:95 stop:682 length:588 start_codon:yes stop_codon:yes gene_type:complete
MKKKYVYLTKEEELELVNSYLKGNTKSFGPLFQKYQMVFYKKIKDWYGKAYSDPEEVNDMAIDFLGRISKKLHLYDSKKAQFNTWMTRSMKNFTVEYWNKKQRQKRIKNTERLDKHYGLADPSADLDKQLELKGHRKLIREMLESLGPEDTRMFNEVLVKGESMAETARKMGIKYSTFEYRFKRLKRRLEKFRPE